MFLLISLLIKELDIWIGSVDIIPDIIGALLLCFAVCTSHYKYSNRTRLYSIVTILLILCSYLPLSVSLLPWILYSLQLLFDALLLLGILKDLTVCSSSDDPSVWLYISLTKTCILLLIICNTLGLLLSLFTFGTLIISLLQILSIFTILYVFYKLQQQ